MSFSSFFSGSEGSLSQSTFRPTATSSAATLTSMSSLAISQPSDASLPRLTSSSIELINASERGDTDAVRRSLSQNADPNAFAGDMRRSSMHRSCAYGHTDVVRLLVDAGGRPDVKSLSGRTPMHEACVGGHVEIVEMLASSPDVVDLADRDRRTPAHLAAFHGEAECLNSLCTHGADASLEDKHGCTPAHLAALNNHPIALQCVMDRGFDADSRDRRGRTPAHYAAEGGSLECLKLMVRTVVDVTCSDGLGLQPVHVAASNDHLECMEYLLEHGDGNVGNVDKQGRTVLHMAAHGGGQKCLHWLLQSGADPNVTDYSGATPAHLAAANGRIQCVNCLIQHGATTSILNSRGDDVLAVAKRHGHPVAVTKAINNNIKCELCEKQRKKQIKEIANRPTDVEANITRSQSTIFMLPQRLPVNKTARQSRSSVSISCLKKTAKKEDVTRLPRREMAAKYFGEQFTDFV